ncbi:MAG TPA: alpha-1,2-fucosyltransferase [Pirellulales bacterium]|nr:alpha-1,2-fucosyltransferase [Pirellulales bacterium]
MQGTFSVSRLGTMGRFGNMVFQYMFAKTYARRFGLRVECPAWVGNYLFAASDPPVERQLPIFREKDSHGRHDALIPNRNEPLAGHDIHGYFQYHTSYYAPDRDYLRDVFRLAPRLDSRLARGWEPIAARGKTAVGIHVRRGDYGHSIFYRTPIDWYLRWLEAVWPTLDEPFLYVASDDVPLVAKAFSDYQPAMLDDFRVNVGHTKLDFIRDWYALSRCQCLAMPNSTFSFSAAMFAEPGIRCFRSSLVDRGFISIEPWDAQPLVNGPEALAENFPDIPDLLTVQPGKKRRLRTMVRRLFAHQPLRRLQVPWRKAA